MRIALILTGGTICSRAGFDGTRRSDVGTASTVLEQHYRLAHPYSSVEFDVQMPLNALSEDLTPDDWCTLLRTIAALDLKRYDGIIIAHESTSPQEIMRVLVWICELPLHIYIVPELYSVVNGRFKANLVYGFELQELFAFTMPPWQVRVKRIIDIAFGLFLGLLSLPVCLFAAIAIKLDDHGPVFYSQERIGLYGKPFTVYKFRTMRTDAEKFGAQWATKKDPRITRIGRFLRKTRIDELPQILCVLKGDMSMVGPRPERAVFIGKLREQIPFYISRLKMKPGLTGWAQVCHHYDTSIEDVQIKLQYDMYYYENMSLLLDFQILVRTVYVVLTGKGAQ